MTLYNLKTDGDQYRITKFTNDLDVESSYLLSETECECPAGHRPTCRHRQMLPTMLANDLADSGGFYDFDHDQVLMPTTFELEPEPKLTGLQEEQILMGFHQPEFCKPEIDLEAKPEPCGFAHPSIGPIKRRI